MMLSRRRLTLAALGLTAALAAQAQAPATAPVQTLHAGLEAAMRAGAQTAFAQRAAALLPVVRQSFDLPLILQNSVGARYAGFSPAAKAALLDVFTQFTVATYVANFDDMGDRLELVPGLRQVGADAVVQTRVVSPGETTRLDYVVRPVGGAWKIVDVLLNGSISRVAVQRSDFRALLASGDAEALIQSLQSKVQRLAGAAG